MKCHKLANEKEAIWQAILSDRFDLGTEEQPRLDGFEQNKLVLTRLLLLSEGNNLAWHVI